MMGVAKYSRDVISTVNCRIPTSYTKCVVFSLVGMLPLLEICHTFDNCTVLSV